jgi:hypothetical protein
MVWFFVKHRDYFTFTITSPVSVMLTKLDTIMHRKTLCCVLSVTKLLVYEDVSKTFRTESITKYMLTTINTRWEATQMVMAAKLTRLTHKIAIQLHLVVESCTICSSRSRRPVRKLLDTPSYVSLSLFFFFTASSSHPLIFTAAGIVRYSAASLSGRAP